MPGYIKSILNRFHQPLPIKPELAPYRYASRSFSATNAQSPIPDDDTTRLDTSGVLRVQRVVGCILYYAREMKISHFYPPSQRSAPTKRRQPKKPLLQRKNSVIVLPHSPTPSFRTSSVTCVSGLTPTPLSRPSATPVDALADSFISRRIPPR